MMLYYRNLSYSFCEMNGISLKHSDYAAPPANGSADFLTAAFGSIAPEMKTCYHDPKANDLVWAAPARQGGPSLEKQSIRSILTQQGVLVYTLLRGRVKNINFRVHRDGGLRVSAPAAVPLREVDELVRQRAPWYYAARQRVQEQPQPQACLHTDEEALAFFQAISDRVYPAFSHILKEKPELRVKEMKSRWGVCYPAKRRITLNKRLLNKPLAAAEYVVVHEYAHFVHPDHQKGFHELMKKLMPDYKERRKLLSDG